VACVRCALFVLFALFFAAPAHAGAVIDRIKSGGVIRCGGVPRSGLFGLSPTGHSAAGLYLDLCRAIGAAVLGPEGRIEFRGYDSEKAFDTARAGADDVMFLSGTEVLAERLADKAILGPTVYFGATGVMVPDQSPVKQLHDLAGQSICFYQGTNAERDIDAWMAAHGLDFVRKGFMEYVEDYDTYNAQVCKALSGEIQDLAAERLDDADKPLNSRILSEPLATFPIVAATPTTDGQWSAIVALAIATVQRAEIPATPWRASGLDSLLATAPELGLAEDWQKRVVGAAGGYADIYARNLGVGSRLKLPRGLNAPLELGGGFVTPYDN
jgi:general L-amino acid transport system substrate-binding protein